MVCAHPEVTWLSSTDNGTKGLETQCLRHKQIINMTVNSSVHKAKHIIKATIREINERVSDSKCFAINQSRRVKRQVTNILTDILNTDSCDMKPLGGGGNYYIAMKSGRATSKPLGIPSFQTFQNFIFIYLIGVLRSTQEYFMYRTSASIMRKMGKPTTSHRLLKYCSFIPIMENYCISRPYKCNITQVALTLKWIVKKKRAFSPTLCIYASFFHRKSFLFCYLQHVLFRTRYLGTCECTVLTK